MSFLAPFWLLGLLPWAAVVGWLLSGQHERAAVPFLELWRGGETPLPKSRRSVRRPPVSILLLLAASLLGIFAASRPRIDSGSSEARRSVIVVVDRGITMSARGAEGSARWAELMEGAEPLIRRHLGDAAIHYEFLPQEESSLVDTRNRIGPAVQRVLLQDGAIVVAITDRVLEIDDPRLIQLSPETVAKNVGIVSAAASESPHAQVMVRLRNDSELKQAQLKVGAKIESIDLPLQGQERNYFVNVNAIEDSISVELVAEDDLAADNRVKLIRRTTWPRIEAHAAISPELVRMIETYRKLRPSEETASRIIVSSGQAIGTTSPGVIITSGDRVITGDAAVESHAITSHVNWDMLMRQGIRIADPPSADWTPIVSAGSNPIVAIRQSPARQVWVGFSSDTFARSSDFVIFWTNVFDWVGGDKVNFETQGTLAVAMPVPPEIDVEQQFNRLPAHLERGKDVSVWPAATAVLLIFLSAISWGVAKIAR